MPTPGLQMSQHFEWDTPWSMGFLIAAVAFLLLWTIWQLAREGRLSQSRWWVLFLLMRMTVATVLLWMILGPTTVLTRTETRPKTLAVYVDISTSMQIQEQPDPPSDRRWQLAADYQTRSLAAADRTVLFASMLRNQTKRLIDAIEQQASTEERQELAMKWQHLESKCRAWLESDTLKQTRPVTIEPLHLELVQTLNDELHAALAETAWITGLDPGDRDDRLSHLADSVDQFVARCRVLAEELAHNASENFTAAPGPVSTRLQRVIPALRQSLSAWSNASKNTFRIQLSQFAEHVSPLTLEEAEQFLKEGSSVETNTASVRRTDLSDLLKQIRDDAGKEDIAAAVVLTDGRHTLQTPDDPRDLAVQLRLPLFLVPIGHGEMRRDLILQHVHAPTSVIQHDKILIEGIVTAHHCSGEGCDIRLSESHKLLETRRIQFSADQDDQRFRFEIPTDKIARREFTISVEPVDGEHSLENNTQSVAVDVTDDMMRILLTDGQARWEYQYLVNLFNRQEKIELDQLHFVPNAVGTGQRKKSHQFPQNVQDWSEYRVVILGDVSSRQLTQQSQESLRAYVAQRGGSLIVIAGQNHMPHSFAGEPLEQLLPVEAARGFTPDRQGYRVEFTAEGRTNDAMLLRDDLPSTEQIWHEASTSMPIYFLSNYHKPKPNSHVLLNAVSVRGASKTESPALLSWQTVGAGRVAYLSAPATYQLRNRHGDTYHHRFWGQLVRWIVSHAALSGSKTVKLLADKSNYTQGDVAQLSVDLTDLEGHPVENATPQIEIVQRDHVSANVELTPDSKIPGRYRGSFPASDIGKFTLRPRGAEIQRLLDAEKYVDPVETQIEVASGLDRELSDPRADRPLLQHLAEQTGGLVLEPTALVEVIHAASLEPQVITSFQRTPLWNRWWCLWLILGCLTAEWLIRKRVGLA